MDEKARSPEFFGLADIQRSDDEIPRALETPKNEWVEIPYLEAVLL